MTELPIFIHQSCLIGNHLGVDLYTDPEYGLVANDCGVCFPEVVREVLDEPE